MGYQAFKITALNLHWLSNTDDENDLCAHSPVFLQIGDKVLSREDDGDWTVSAAALYLLRTLFIDYKPGDWDNALLPHCGNLIYYDKKQMQVGIVGCNIGIDWSVQHFGNRVELSFEGGSKVEVAFEEYRKKILAFADLVDSFYKNSKPKVVDKCDIEGYYAFWKEWRTLFSKAQMGINDV